MWRNDLLGGDDASLRALFWFTLVIFLNCFTDFVTLLLFSVSLLADKKLREELLCREFTAFIRQHSYFFLTESFVCFFLTVLSWAEDLEVLLMLFLFCQCFVGISATPQLALIRPDRADAKNFHRNSRLKFRSMPLLCSGGINYAWICQLQWVSKRCPTQSSILSTAVSSRPPFLLPVC